MTLQELQESGYILFECVSGSRAYGLDTPASDLDIRGVFVLPQAAYYGMNYFSQISNESNDIVYYELKKFVELCQGNNPNILELLNVPEECIRYKHPLFDRFTMEMFLSKKCEKSFANYAYSQIKKAQGLEKKIVNPVEKERKSVLDFCYVYDMDQPVELKFFLEQKGLKQENCGLSRYPHMRDCYAMFHSLEIPYKGIMKKEDSNDVSLSTTPKGEKTVCLLYFNKDAYSIYCKKHREYWEWVEKRNQDRYTTTMTHAKNYDSKNMMHTFRLLEMAREIALESLVRVRRPNREFLLEIKSGKYDYEDLLQRAAQIKEELEELYLKSTLPLEPNAERIEKTLVGVRQEFYQEKSN